MNMPEPPELTPEELQRITKRRQHAAQARVLGLLGIPYRRHPMDGSILVGRQALTQALHREQADTGTEPSSGIQWLSQS